MNYNNNDPIPDSTNSTWGTAIIGARTGYDVSVVPLNDYVGTFGYLYNWYAVNDPRKLCPAGWHVPTDAEWTTMIQTLDPSQVVNGTIFGSQSTTAGTVMKSTVTITPTLTIPGSGLGWNFCGLTTTNASGFSALPGGFRSGNVFTSVNVESAFWSADEIGSGALFRLLGACMNDVNRATFNKSYGTSVRCLRD
jgi:uncharacterized protein (TIGR02145 family)